MTETKRCCRCKRELPITEFNKNRIMHDGLNTICKECNREQCRKNYAKNGEKYKARWREKYRTDSQFREKCNDRSKRWYAANRGYNREYQKTYAAALRELRRRHPDEFSDILHNIMSDAEVVA